MASTPMLSLTSGSGDVTFDEAVASIQNYGFRQSVFEVERVNPMKLGTRDFLAGQIIVLRPSRIQTQYQSMKPGDKVQCTGLSMGASGIPVVCRIRRMAEGISRKTMTERI